MSNQIFINQVQAAGELGIDRKALQKKLARKQIKGAKKVGGRWQIPSPQEGVSNHFRVPQHDIATKRP